MAVRSAISLRVGAVAAVLVVVACHHVTPEEAESACYAKNGRYYVNDRFAEDEPDGGERFGVCIERAEEGQRKCSSKRECGIACICEGEPKDGEKATGICADFPPMAGSGWHCTIDQNGIAHPHGMIVGTATESRAPAR